MSIAQPDTHIAQLNEYIDTHGLPIVVEVCINDREYLMLDFPPLRETRFINYARKLIDIVQHAGLSQANLQAWNMIVCMFEQSVRYFIEFVWPGMDVTREPVPASPVLLTSLLELMLKKCLFNRTLSLRIYNCYNVLRSRPILGVLSALTRAIEGGGFDSVRDVTNIPLSMVTDHGSAPQTAASTQLSASASLSSTFTTASSDEEFFTPPQTPAQPVHIGTPQTSSYTLLARQATLPIVDLDPYAVAHNALSRERTLGVGDFQSPSTPSLSWTDTLPAEDFTGSPANASNRDVLRASASVDSLPTNLLSRTSTNVTDLLDTPSRLSTSATFPVNTGLRRSETTSTASSIGMTRSTSMDSIPRSVAHSPSEVWAHVQSQITQIPSERIATLQSMVANTRLLGLNINVAPHGNFVVGSDNSTPISSPAPSHTSEDGAATASLPESPVNDFGSTTAPQSPSPKPVLRRTERSTDRRRYSPFGPRPPAKDVVTKKSSRSSSLSTVHTPNIEVGDHEDTKNKENKPLGIEDLTRNRVNT